MKTFSKFLLTFLVLTLTAILLHKFFPRSYLSALSGQVLQKCSQEENETSCYDREVPKLMKRPNRLSLEEAFVVIKNIQDNDDSFLYCHNLGHKLGEIESKKSGLSGVVNCPLSACNYGCMHGAIAQQFRGDILDDVQIDKLLPQILNICESTDERKLTSIERNMCYHGLGHLAMFITDADPNRSIAMCDRITSVSTETSYTKLCVEGVFMTVFQGGSDPDDVALVANIKPSKDKVTEFCSRYPKYWEVCRRESYPLFADDLRDPAKLVSFCAYATTYETKEYCYLGTINILTPEFFSSRDGLARLETYCNALPQDDRSTCFIGAAARLIQSDPLRFVPIAAEVCSLTSKYGLDARCFRLISGYSKLLFGSEYIDQRKNYCDQLPEDWRSDCLYN